jgi:hypothetical protein
MPEAPQIEYTDEQVLAKLADTEGWKKVVDWANHRIEYYKRYYPGGEGVSKATSSEEIAIGWKTSTQVISELEQLIGQVEAAKNAIKARQQ